MQKAKETFSLPVFDTQGKEVEVLALDKHLFDGVVNTAVIYQAVCAYRANQRKGLAATKTRGEVSGGGAKPWRQKGTGRARVGSSRNPLWRHGGVVFGPHPRNFSYNLPQKIRSLALKSSLNAKLKENNLIIIDKFELPSIKTKEAAAIFSRLKITKDSKTTCLLLLSEGTDKKVKLALRNMKFLRYNLGRDAHAYDVLCCEKLLVTKPGLNELVKRFNPPSRTSSLKRRG